VVFRYCAHICRPASRLASKQPIENRGQAYTGRGRVKVRHSFLVAWTPGE
jgi:hypothetical protein